MNFFYIQCTPDLYGAGRMLLRTAARLIQDGHSVWVVLPEDGPLAPVLRQAGCTVEIINLDPTIRKKYFKSPVALFRFLRDCVRSIRVFSGLCREARVDRVCSNTSQTVVGGLIARRLKVPHICHVRESYAGFGVFWRVYREFLLWSSWKMICVSNAIAEQFPQRHIGRRVVTVRDGFPLDEFDPVPAERIDVFRERYGLGDCRLVGLVGRIILQRKGQDVFVQAIALLKDKYPDVRFLMIGACYPGNEYHLDNLNQLIAELGVRDQVICTGEVDDIHAAYASLDISVMASATPEPFGGVTIESMIFGKPVVGTNIGGTPEQIEDKVTGLLIPPNDPDEMADAIARLIADESLRHQMGTAGRKRFEAEFEFERFYSEIRAMYQCAVGESE